MNSTIASEGTLRSGFRNQIERLWPLAKGSVAEVRKPCVRPNCPACKEGRKHRAFIFTYRAQGKTHCRHVPADFVPRLREALRNGRELEQLLVQLGARLLEHHRQQRRRRDGRRAE
jgi:hypothetical protein